jgi:hypothetical protein
MTSPASLSVILIVSNFASYIAKLLLVIRRTDIAKFSLTSLRKPPPKLQQMLPKTLLLPVACQVTAAIATTLPSLPLPQLLSPLLPLPHFLVCCLPPQFLLLSAAAVATVAATATAAPVLTWTPSLKDPNIVALSPLPSLALRSSIFDYYMPESLWLLL